MRITPGSKNSKLTYCNLSRSECEHNTRSYSHSTRHHKGKISCSAVLNCSSRNVRTAQYSYTRSSMTSQNRQTLITAAMRHTSCHAPQKPACLHAKAAREHRMVSVKVQQSANNFDSKTSLIVALHPVCGCSMCQTSPHNTTYPSMIGSIYSMSNPNLVRSSSICAQSWLLWLQDLVIAALSIV